MLELTYYPISSTTLNIETLFDDKAIFFDPYGCGQGRGHEFIHKHPLDQYFVQHWGQVLIY